MDAEKIKLFIATNGDIFPSSSLPTIKQRLEGLPENREMEIATINYINPTISLILSIFIGIWGVDRFYIGDKWLGFGKLAVCIVGCLILAIIGFVVGYFTAGIGTILMFLLLPFLYIWPIIDWFLIMGATKKKNLEKLLTVIG